MIVTLFIAININNISIIPIRSSFLRSVKLKTLDCWLKCFILQINFPVPSWPSVICMQHNSPPSLSPYFRLYEWRVGVPIIIQWIWLLLLVVVAVVVVVEVVVVVVAVVEVVVVVVVVVVIVVGVVVEVIISLKFKINFIVIILIFVSNSSWSSNNSVNWSVKFNFIVIFSITIFVIFSS